MNRVKDPETAPDFKRRHFLALGATMGATLFAGCSTGTDPTNGVGGTSSGDTDGSNDITGTFRLLISDQPVAVGDFDELDVSFERAGIFHGEGDEDDDDEETETETETETELETETETDTEEDDESDDGEQRGFFTIDLDGATVDLTEVVGEKAMGVFDGELPEGRYTKIELYVADVEGLVDGELVDVMVPSNKLQIVKPFEVVAGETLTFVFDINVVKKGQTDEYNLLPVISKSGVAGKDVEVQEVRNARADADEDEDEEEDEEEETEEVETEEEEADEGSGNGEGEGPPDDAVEDS